MAGERNKELVRRLVESLDQNWGSLDHLDEVFTADLKLHFNGADMTLDEYKQMVPAIYSAFSDVRHEFQFQTAEDDVVTNVITIHAKHVGEWEGIAATGRAVTISDIAVTRIQGDRIVEEWVVVDMAGLKHQLESE